MGLQDELTQDLKQAMRNTDTARRDTLRLLRAEITNAEIAAGRPLTDQEVVDLLGKEAKRRREAISTYSQAGRKDLAEKEMVELGVIEVYLPRQLERAEIEVVARQAVSELGATDVSQVGAVMRYVMPRFKDRADGRLVNEVVRSILLS